jgi:hypothetical protein
MEGSKMKFAVQFKIGDRLSAVSRFSLRDICVGLVERYALTEREITTLVSLPVGEQFFNKDLVIRRLT